MWENNYKRWIYEWKQAQRTEEQKAADEAAALQLEAEGKEPEVDADSISPYTLPKAGVNKFGG